MPFLPASGEVRAMNDWSDEETDDPLYADRRNFYKVEKWTEDGTKVDCVLYAATTSPKPAMCSGARCGVGHGSG